MGTIVRFTLHGASPQAYRQAFAVLARMGLDALEGPHLGLSRAGLPAAALATGSGDPAELTRAAFVALQGAQLHPVAVTGAALDRAAFVACA